MANTWLRIGEIVGQIATTVRNDIVDAAVSPRSPIGWIGALRFVAYGAIVLWLKLGFDYVNERPTLLPAKVFLSRSTWQDLGVIMINTTLLAAIGQAVAPADLPSRLTAAFQSLFAAGISIFTPPGGQPSAPTQVLAVVVVVLSMDFGSYFIHRLMHRLPFLWEFHKVHHSAAVLSPLTSVREHVFETLLRILTSAVIVGFTTGVMLHFLPHDAVVAAMARGASVYGFLFVYVLLLNHSHIWWSWGPLEYFLNSPAMHVIHHSRDPVHFNKNMGNLLAIWDVMFGTHQRTQRTLQPISIGLDDGLNWANASQAVLFTRPFARAIAAWRTASARVRSTAGPSVL